MKEYTMTINAEQAKNNVENYISTQQKDKENKVIDFIAQEIEPALQQKSQTGGRTLSLRLPDSIDKHMFINIIELNKYTVANGINRELTIMW